MDYDHPYSFAEVSHLSYYPPNMLDFPLELMSTIVDVRQIAKCLMNFTFKN